MGWWLSGPDGWCPQLYEAFFIRTRWGRSLRAAEATVIRAFLRPHAQPGTLALEIGPGTGAYTSLLAAWGCRVETREPSPAMRRHLRDRARREGWSQSVVVGSGALPDLEVDDRYPLVVAIGVLNYVEDLPAALTALAAAGRPDGVVVANVPTARRPGGRYELIERMGRRRVHRRDRHAVAAAARTAGLRHDAGPIPAGVTDLYRWRVEPTTEISGPGPHPGHRSG